MPLLGCLLAVIFLSLSSLAQIDYSSRQMLTLLEIKQRDISSWNDRMSALLFMEQALAGFLEQQPKAKEVKKFLSIYQQLLPYDFKTQYKRPGAAIETQNLLRANLGLPTESVDSKMLAFWKTFDATGNFNLRAAADETFKAKLKPQEILEFIRPLNAYWQAPYIEYITDYFVSQKPWKGDFAELGELLEKSLETHIKRNRPYPSSQISKVKEKISLGLETAPKQPFSIRESFGRFCSDMMRAMSRVPMH